jgi:hypothetical protein
LNPDPEQVAPLGQQPPLQQTCPAGQAAPVVPHTQLPSLQWSALLPQATHTSPSLPQAVKVVPA